MASVLSARELLLGLMSFLIASPRKLVEEDATGLPSDGGAEWRWCGSCASEGRSLLNQAKMAGKGPVRRQPCSC